MSDIAPLILGIARNIGSLPLTSANNADCEKCHSAPHSSRVYEDVNEPFGGDRLKPECLP